MYFLYNTNYDCQIMGVKIGKRLRRPPPNHKDVGSNPAATRNEKTDIGGPPQQKKWPNRLDRI